MADEKFSQFANDGDVLQGDVIVGVRGGVNAKFSFNPAVKIPVVNPTALSTLPTTGFADGSGAYVQSLRKIFYLNQTSTETPDNIDVIAAVGGGNWISGRGRQFTASSDAAMLDLPANEGDWVVRTDLNNNVYMRNNRNTGGDTDWTPLRVLPSLFEGAHLLTGLSTYTVATTDVGKALITVNQACTVTIPLMASLPSNFCFYAKSGAAFEITVAATSTDTIEGMTSITLANNHGALIYADGAGNWRTGSTELFNLETKAVTSGPLNITGADLNRVLELNSSGTSIAVNLPLIGTSNVTNQFHFYLKNIGSVDGVVFPTSPNLIDGQLTATIIPGQGMHIFCDGTNFYDLNKSWSGTSGIKSISAATYTLLPIDNGATLLFTNTGNVTVTIPQESTAFLPENFKITLINIASPLVTLVNQGSDSTYGPLHLAINNKLELEKIGTGSPAFFSTFNGNINAGVYFAGDVVGVAPLPVDGYSIYLNDGSGIINPIKVKLPAMNGTSAPSIGQPLRFYNPMGSIPFQIYANDGTTLLIILFFQEEAILTPTDNTTANGTFYIRKFSSMAAQSSAAVAITGGTLDGVIITNSPFSNTSVIVSATTYTPDSTIPGGIITFTNAAASTLTLPQESVSLIKFGSFFQVFNKNSSVVNIATQGSNTLDGATTISTGRTVTIMKITGGTSAEWVATNFNFATPLSPSIGGLGVANPTAHGILVAEGASAVNPIVLTKGQVLLGATSADPAASLIDASVWVDGTGTITPMEYNGAYTTNSSATTFILPATAPYGSVLSVATIVGGLGWNITQNAGQSIIFVNGLITTVGTSGSISSTQVYQFIKLLCVVANNQFLVIESSGNLSIV